MINEKQQSPQTIKNILQEVRQNLEGLSTGDLRPSAIQYTREGNSFSVRILPPQPKTSLLSRKEE
jgi:hypothetical protein